MHARTWSWEGANVHLVSRREDERGSEGGQLRDCLTLCGRRDKEEGEVCLPTLEAHPETRLHGEDGTEAVPGTGSRRWDVGEDAADRRSLGLGEMSGQPGHEPQGEECHQVEICPNTPFYTVHGWEYCGNPLFWLWGE